MEMRFEITQDGEMGYTLAVNGEVVLECQSRENLMGMTFEEVLHLIEEVSK